MTEQQVSKATKRRRMRAWYADLFANIPEGYTPLEAVLVVECLADDGNVALVTRKTSGMSPWKAYGCLSYALDDYSSSTMAAAAEPAEDDE